MSKLSYKPLSQSTWNDFENLFGAVGACAGCWCMHWKLKRSEFMQSKGEGNKEKQHKIVQSGIKPGILLYKDGEAIGWCAVEPRIAYPVMANSKVMRPPDDFEVWSISCFFIRKDHRKKGLSVQLLEYVKEYCKEHSQVSGATIIEGYPYDIKKMTAPPFVWTGLSNAFLKAGFKEVARNSPTRPIMRFFL